MDTADQWSDATVSGGFSERRLLKGSRRGGDPSGDRIAMWSNLTVRFSRHFARRLHKVAKSDC